MKKAPRIEVITRGLWQDGERVLVCRGRRGGYCYLPGGHVEFGESAAVALQREFMEECGVAVEVGDCLLVTEEVFDAGERRHHEFNLVFHVERHGQAHPVVSLEPEIDFDWVVRSELARSDFRPASILSWLIQRPTPKGNAPTARWISNI